MESMSVIFRYIVPLLQSKGKSCSEKHRWLGMLQRGVILAESKGFSGAKGTKVLWSCRFWLFYGSFGLKVTNESLRLLEGRECRYWGMG